MSFFSSVAACLKYDHGLTKDSGVWVQKQCKGQAPSLSMSFVPNTCEYFSDHVLYVCKVSPALSNRNKDFFLCRIHFLLYNRVVVSNYTHIVLKPFNTNFIFGMQILGFPENLSRRWGEDREKPRDEPPVWTSPRLGVTLQFVIITQFVIHYKLRWIATQFVIHRISNCVVKATRFVMYYKLRQNFIILKYWKGEKKFINCKMHRFNNILLWIQLDTNLFKLGMQNSQSTLHLVRTLFCPRTFAIFFLGGGGGIKTRSSVRLLVCLSVPLSVTKPGSYLLKC